MAYLKSLLNPEQILQSNFEVMSVDELRDHLRELVLGEKDSVDRNAYLFETLETYEIKFREKRFKVSKRYIELGGKLNPLMLNKELPSIENWVGIQGLIKS